jgi:hypothetical protein
VALEGISLTENLERFIKFKETARRLLIPLTRTRQCFKGNYPALGAFSGFVSIHSYPKEGFMKKLIALLMAMALSLAVLTACSGGEEKSAPAEKTTQEQAAPAPAEKPAQ